MNRWTQLTLTHRESLNATLKRETLQGRKGWNSAGEARAVVFRWITRYR